MCFSQTASFAVAGALTPVGFWCVHAARRLGPQWTPLAAFPLAFAVQQASEGVLWHGLDAGDPGMIAAAARCFIFFSHFFWPAWVPFAAWRLEAPGWRRSVLLALTGAGALFGLSIFLPSLLFADWLSVEVVSGSIEYQTTLIYDGFVGRDPLRAVYAAIVAGSLLLSSRGALRLFGALIAASLLGTLAAFPHAFISVWCFFAAILSAYVAAALIVERARQKREGRAVSRAALR